MPTYNPRRLCRPEVLRALNTWDLEELLTPYAAFLAPHGVTLPLDGRDAPLKYTALAQLLLAPERGMPADLLDAFYFIDELATPSGMESLLTAGRAKGIYMPQCLEVTPADVALKFWIKDRALVERVHAEMAVERLRTFQYFQPTDHRVPKLPDDWRARSEALERELTECFHSRRRGRYTRIIVDERPDRLWLYIGHGGMLRREAAVDDHGPTSVCYRPEVYDAVVFVRDTGELGIHARTAWETELYQRVLGKHLFGNEEFFGGKAKYSLDPLWEYGRAALQCIDVPEIEWALLTAVTVVEPHRPSYSRSERYEDLFDYWGRDTLPFSPDSRLIRAVLQVKLLGARGPCRVTIRPSNRIEYSRDADQDVMEKWLERRGFVRGDRKHARTEELLAVA